MYLVIGTFEGEEPEVLGIDLVVPVSEGIDPTELGESYLADGYNGYLAVDEEAGVKDASLASALGAFASVMSKKLNGLFTYGSESYEAKETRELVEDAIFLKTALV